MPLSPEARRALEQMNRGPLKQPPSEAPAADLPPPAVSAPSPSRSGGSGRGADDPVPSRRKRAAAGRPAIAGRAPSTGDELALPSPPPETPPLLEHLVPGVVAETSSRRYYLHERRVDVPFAEGRTLAESLARVLTPDGSPDPPGEGDAPRLLFLDIETTGLSNTPLFLVGVLTLDADALLVRQLFARDYSEERAVLEATRALLQQHCDLVTFNGKTFDLPYIANRCVTHRLPRPEARSHMDLLLSARRHWRRFLPNCRLQTIEQQICRRQRVDDIPGEAMGQVYHDFVRTGDATQIRGALHHNLLDLIAMVEMLCLLGGEEGAWPSRSRQEIAPGR